MRPRHITVPLWASVAQFINIGNFDPSMDNELLIHP